MLMRCKAHPPIHTGVGLLPYNTREGIAAMTQTSRESQKMHVGGESSQRRQDGDD